MNIYSFVLQELSTPSELIKHDSNICFLRNNRLQRQLRVFSHKKHPKDAHIYWNVMYIHTYTYL